MILYSEDLKIKKIKKKVQIFLTVKQTNGEIKFNNYAIIVWMYWIVRTNDHASLSYESNMSRIWNTMTWVSVESVFIGFSLFCIQFIASNEWLISYHFRWNSLWSQKIINRLKRRPVFVNPFNLSSKFCPKFRSGKGCWGFQSETFKVKVNGLISYQIQRALYLSYCELWHNYCHINRTPF